MVSDIHDIADFHAKSQGQRALHVPMVEGLNLFGERGDRQTGQGPVAAVQASASAPCAHGSGHRLGSVGRERSTVRRLAPSGAHRLVVEGHDFDRPEGRPVVTDRSRGGEGLPASRETVRRSKAKPEYKCSQSAPFELLAY
jgi:hypothetical protein